MFEDAAAAIGQPALAAFEVFNRVAAHDEYTLDNKTAMLDALGTDAADRIGTVVADRGAIWGVAGIVATEMRRAWDIVASDELLLARIEQIAKEGPQPPDPARDEGRACAQIYGGPETAVVTGTIDGDAVKRRFTRTNGCELADYKRAAGLLQP